MFKPLHVWSSKEATENEEKKKKFAEPGWATAHLSIRLGGARRLARRRMRRARGRSGAGAQEHRARVCGQGAGALGGTGAGRWGARVRQ